MIPGMNAKQMKKMERQMKKMGMDMKDLKGVKEVIIRLEDKEYLKVDKRGRNAYVYPIISEKEYRKEKAEDILDNWFDGSAKELFTALSEKLAYV